MSVYGVDETLAAQDIISPADARDEWLTCAESCTYFIVNYCNIYDPGVKGWIPFDLWPEQFRALKMIEVHLLLVILKARQLGMTWLALCYILWRMLFHPEVVALLFSRRDDEAVHLLDERLKGIYKRLPIWMQVEAFKKDSGHQWNMSNGSTATAFPTNAGDSYTAGIVLVDEADLVPDLGRLMRAVKPTIDAGGQMILLSRSNKDIPNSEFKNTYRGARAKQTDWVPVFLSWDARPTRTQEWYEAQKRDVLARTASLDDLWEQYPATEEEALAPKVLDKRISPLWLQQCYVEVKPVVVTLDVKIRGVPAIPGLKIFRAPIPGRRYVIGVDPAEGNPTSHDSALEVLDLLTGEQVATLNGKFQPSTLASHANKVGIFYNMAAVLVERNNHGHAVLLWLGEFSPLEVLSDEQNDPQKKRPKPGWLTSPRGKILLYDIAADSFREKDTTIHNYDTFAQLSSIEGSSVKAPEGDPDDLADAYSLGLAARTLRSRSGQGWTSH